MKDMKRIFVIFAAVLALCAVQAQVLEENESALVYYSPKTEIRLDFTYTVERFERGQYAEFAESMIGATDAVMETGSVCTLQDVRIGTATTTDYQRPHKVNTDAGFPMLLNINDKGLLTGYNVRHFGGKPAPKKDECEKERKHKAPRVLVPPYPEEVLKAANPEAQAHEVAKQIFHLRETRMYLLNGEVENAPADGEAMRLVLEELDKQERELTRLFVGKRFKREEHKSVRVVPNDAGELLFFSEENGFTDSDNVDADTIEVRMSCEQQVAQPVIVDAKNKKKAPEMTQIVYNIPGYCTVNVLYKGQKLAYRAVPVAQLGIDVALPKSMFVGKDLPKIVFSDKTGNIESINQ